MLNLIYFVSKSKSIDHNWLRNKVGDISSHKDDTSLAVRTFSTRFSFLMSENSYER